MDLDLNWLDAVDVEKYAGKCTCGGSFKVNAPPRCPQCKSSDVLLDIAVNGVHYEEFYN
jgi:ABC-type ATPase with predicted acetyltransferase domain